MKNKISVSNIFRRLFSCVKSLRTFDSYTFYTPDNLSKLIERLQQIIHLLLFHKNSKLRYNYTVLNILKLPFIKC